MAETITILWMRCPFDADLCGAEAELRYFEVTMDGGWQGVLECLNGHQFVLSQPRRIL